MESKVIVSCTTTLDRLKYLYHMLKTLEEQTVQPDEVVIHISSAPYLSDKGISDAPEWMTRGNFRVQETANTGPYRKLIPLLPEIGEEDLLVTADDDILFDRSWLETLLSHARERPDQLIATRARYIRRNKNGHFMNYHNWNRVYSQHSGMNILPLCGAGVVFRKSQLDLELSADTSFLSIAPTTDDLWYRALSLKKGVSVFVDPNIDASSIYLKHDEGLQELNLFKGNSGGVKNILLNKFKRSWFDLIGKPLTANDKAWRAIYHHARLEL